MTTYEGMIILLTLLLSAPNNTLFFCIPNNDRLLKYWDTVEDRLFKIRHCMTIEGKIRELPLFQPPIEPGLLVRAAAAGIDIASVLNDLGAPLPHYRFQVMAQKASELCGEVRSLGSALLAALEKKDAEELTLMRSRHELQLLKLVRDVREKQVEEAKRTHEGLLKAKELIQKRHAHYASLIKRGLNESEKQQLVSMGLSLITQTVAQGLEMAASSAPAVPDAIFGSAGWAGTPVALLKTGGSHAGAALAASARFVNMLASIISTGGTMASVVGGFQRRDEEWQLQQELAAKEGEQIDKQIAAAEIRIAIAEKKLTNHERQSENAAEVDAQMRSKFTNKELYFWMETQLSSLYFGSYQLAYDLAKRAEKGYRHELGLADSDFIKFGYWDSLKKGLLAGERLHSDLKRMEAAYFEQNAREYEITKHVSLALLNPIALLTLKTTSECFLDLPEAIFDLDYPGHYMRRIKSVGLSIPCVTGPYTGVNCTLSLLKSSIRHDPANNQEGYRRDDKGGQPDDRFQDTFGAVQSIAASTGQNDSGLFEVNLRDERYLPFEGQGVISSWHIQLPTAFRHFDYETITDVILHLRYSARDGGEILRQKAADELSQALNEMLMNEAGEGFLHVVSVKHEFPREWNRLFEKIEGKANKYISITLKKPDVSYLPFMFQDKKVEFKKVTLILQIRDVDGYDNNDPLEMKIESQEPKHFKRAGGAYGGLPSLSPDNYPAEQDWRLSISGKTLAALPKPFTNKEKDSYCLNKEAIQDILLFVNFSVSKKKN